MQTVLTIVTITKNDVEGFNRTLASVENFIGDSLQIEWIIVNAGNELNSISKRVRKVRVISEPDSGPFAGMNKGLCFAEGKYINFMNSGDTILSEIRRDEVINELCECSGIWAMAEAKKEIHDGVQDWKIPKRKSFLYWLGLNSFPHQSTFYKTSILRKLNGFNPENIASDYEISLNFLNIEIPHKLPMIYSLNSKGGISDRIGAREHTKNIMIAHRNVFHQTKARSILEYPVIYAFKKLSEFKNKNYV